MNAFERQRVEVLPKKHGREFSQFDMAVRCGGVTPSAIGSWEREEATPRLSQVPRIARGYEMTEAEVENEILAISRRLRSAITVTD